MNSQLQKLIEFQQFDLDIIKLKECAHETPKAIKELSETLDEHRKEVGRSETILDNAKSSGRELELEVESLKETLVKYQSQLMEVQTNKEYDAMLKEISVAERGIAKKENQILEGMIVIEEKEQVVSVAQREFQKQEQEILQTCSKLEKSASEAQDQIDALQQQKSQLQNQIPSELIEQYERIAIARNGIALTEAKEQSCQACHVRLRPQLFAEIRTTNEIIQCENCSRFLYWAGSSEE